MKNILVKSNFMSLLSQIAKNTFYQIIGKIFGAIFGLLTVGLMTRHLGQVGYGYFTTAIAFTQFFGVLADFGLQMAGTHFLSRAEIDKKKILGNLLALRIVSAIAFLGAGILLIWLFPYPTIVKQAAFIAGFSFFFVAVQSVLISVFQKNMEMSRVAAAETIGRVVLFSAVWLAVALNQGLLIIVGAVAVGSLTTCLILFSGAKKYYPLKPRFDLEIWKKIWEYTWPLAVSITFTLIYFRADTIILSIFHPAETVGIYGATYKVLEILIQFPYLFLGLILPLLTKFFISNKKIFQLIFQKTFDFLATLAIPMILAVWVLGEKIMIFVAGSEFAASGAILKILIIGAAIIYLKALFGYTIAACQLQKKMIKFYLLDAFISLGLYLLLIPLFSYWAAAGLTVLSELFAAVAAFVVLRRQLKISLEIKTALKALGAGIIMALTLTLLLGQNLITLVIVGLIIYFTVLYLIRGFSKETVLEIIKLKK